MPTRTLTAGEHLWESGEPATTLVVVEQGRLSIRDGSDFVGHVPPGSTLGESAILSLDGETVVRTAAVAAMTDAVVTEIPVTLLQETLHMGTPKLVLRTLYGQVCRNVLLILAAQNPSELAEAILSGQLRALAECEPRFRKIKQWPEFIVAFRVLYQWRESSDVLRRQLAAGRTLDVPRALSVLRGLVPSLEAIDTLKPFLEISNES